MAKANTEYTCQNCGSVHSKWAGRCEDCGSWNSLQEEAPSKNFSKLAPINKNAKSTLEFSSLSAEVENVKRIASGFEELDRVLGGGLVLGSVILLGGDPGIGKSTLLLQLASKLVGGTINCAYISGEESLSQIILRSKRLNCNNPDVKLLCVTNLQQIISNLKKDKTINLVIIDSIQTMFLDNLDSAPGTVSQVRACCHELVRYAKENNVVVLIVGHVTKDGQIAGPKLLEHMVDTVLYFEGERGHQFRIIRAVKNRFGSINEIGVFEMLDSGLEEVLNPSALFLSQRHKSLSGSTVFAGIEGTRPILIEIQALVAPCSMATPRRAVIGWDHNRLAMIIAVLATRYGLNLLDKEVYLNVAGGIKITEPAADLAVAAALISAATDTPLPTGSVIFGEIGLGGEIRIVGHADKRLKEAEKLGFNKAVIPEGSKFDKTGMSVYEIEHIKELMQ